MVLVLLVLVLVLVVVLVPLVLEEQTRAKAGAWVGGDLHFPARQAEAMMCTRSHSPFLQNGVVECDFLCRWCGGGYSRSCSRSGACTDGIVHSDQH